MKRPFSSYAYSMAPIRRCYWADAVAPEDLHARVAEGDISTQVAVIGGGYTGLNAALTLAEAGEDVVLLDAEFPGWGASGRNGGFCCLGGSAAKDGALDRRFGPGAAREVRNAEVAAIEHVAGVIDRLGLNVDRHTDGDVILAHNPAKMASLREEIAWYRDAYGGEPELIEPGDMAARGMAGPFHGALVMTHGFALHPRKYLFGLDGAATAAGARIFGNSPVQAIHPTSGGYMLETPQARVNCKRLIVATNGYSSDDLPPWMRHRFLPTQSSIIATRPMSDAELAAQGWTSHQMAYEDRRLLHYFHLTADNRMVFGQRGGLISSRGNDERLARKVRADFNAMFPAWEHVEAPYYWSGMVCLNASLTPFCGAIPEMPGAFAAFGYHGNGVAMASYCGAVLGDLVRGVVPRLKQPRAFAAPPPPFPFGRLRRVGLAAEYLWAIATDR